MTIEELKQAYEAATLGPWEVFGETRPRPLICSEAAVSYDDENGAGIIARTEGPNAERAPNARLIVAAVNNLPRLLKVAEASEPLARLAETHHARSPSEDYVPASLLWDLFTALHGETPAEARQRKALEELNND